MRIGSDDHKELFCRSFMATHRKYEPEDLAWPDLSDEDVARLRGIPFWTEAISMETEAGLMVRACAASVDDPLVQEAIALQGYEEARHGRLLQHMIGRYGLESEERLDPALDPDVESAFVDFGYRECLDSFGSFGIYALAREVEFLSEPMLDIFENVVQEEANHIVFFINWLAWRDARRGRPAALRNVKALWHYGKAVAGHVRMALGAEKGDDRSFTSTGGSTFVANLTPTLFLETCLRENERRLGGFPEELLRPRLIPALARGALLGLKLLPPWAARES